VDALATVAELVTAAASTQSTATPKEVLLLWGASFKGVVGWFSGLGKVRSVASGGRAQAAFAQMAVRPPSTGITAPVM
jgi:hypothetical protein